MRFKSTFKPPFKHMYDKLLRVFHIKSKSQFDPKTLNMEEHTSLLFELGHL